MATRLVRSACCAERKTEYREYPSPPRNSRTHPRTPAAVYDGPGGRRKRLLPQRRGHRLQTLVGDGGGRGMERSPTKPCVRGLAGQPTQTKGRGGGTARRTVGLGLVGLGWLVESIVAAGT